MYLLSKFLFAILFLTSCSYNKYSPDSNEILSTLKTDLSTKPEECVLFCGNPGVGKSSLCNSIFQKSVFSSGVSAGIGMTTLQQSHDYEGSTYIDTPGLEDITFREQAAKQIEKALKLKNGGKYKLIFVVMLDAGRIRPADLATINAICGAIGADFEYGIIFNKVTVNARKKIDEIGKIEQHLTQLIKAPSKWIFISYNPEMYDESDIFFLKESCEIEKLTSFIRELNGYSIQNEAVSSLDIANFDEKIQKIEKKYKEEIKSLQQETDDLQIQSNSNLHLLLTGIDDPVLNKNIFAMRKNVQEMALPNKTDQYRKELLKEYYNNEDQLIKLTKSYLENGQMLLPDQAGNEQKNRNASCCIL